MIQKLLSLPAGYVTDFHQVEKKELPEWVVSCDPPGGKLGSGGGTAHLLYDAWRQSGAGSSFTTWLDSSRKLMIHAGGHSRRLPAYAAVGKVGTPVPAMRWAATQCIDQSLMDMQAPFFEALLNKAPATSKVMITSGDVLLLGDLAKIRDLPDADVICIGMWTTPETACNHGVFYCPHEAPGELSFFAQKPSPDDIRAQAATHSFLVDTGIWILSARAVNVLMNKCNWDPTTQAFGDGTCHNYELYGDFGLGFGKMPIAPDTEVSSLSVAVVPLPAGEFYHFGKSRDLLSSCLQLQNRVQDQHETGGALVKPHPEIFIQNSQCDTSAFTEGTKGLWIENSQVAPGWQLTEDSIITGIPENNWSITIPAGLCLDCVPVGESEYAVRVYGIDDTFRGELSNPVTLYCGTPFKEWLEHRGLSLDAAELDGAVDIQAAEIFPVLTEDELTDEFIQWLLTGASHAQESCRETWIRKRISADGIAGNANLYRLYRQRTRFLSAALPRMAANSQRSIFYRLDLNRCAHYYAETEHALPEFPATAQIMKSVRQNIFNATVQRRRGAEDWRAYEETAFRTLQRGLLDTLKNSPELPELSVMSDQVVWGRSPIRLDFAGGWTDAPPFCLEHGGSVVNAAVDLNGQPPIQVFIRCCSELTITFRSIDLGVEYIATSYADLAGFNEVGSAFSIPKAALCLAGFHPDYCATRFTDLQHQLKAFGGGFEITLLAAIPKGSGLGTSSILSSTLLGSLSDFCNLGWSKYEIANRVLLLEQLLTTGGGWQDQYGGIFRGIKLLKSQPGFDQTPAVHWLPGHLFEHPDTQACMMLYYTGITRVAKNILQDIVRNMFLNDKTCKEILFEMQTHASDTADALTRGDWKRFNTCIARSWELNQQLDAGTNPEPVSSILSEVSDYLASYKLLGAGGGGYLMMLAKDINAAARVRHILTETPPNNRARFVDISLSNVGLKVTRS